MHFATKVVFFFACVFFAIYLPLKADDGIPGNCETSQGAYFQPNLFPRYEPNNQRLVLVDWSTGEIAREIETNLTVAQFNLINWSPDCRYLVGALGASESMDTVIWDVTIPIRLGVVPDAHQVPHRVTWDETSAYAIIETRNGAYLWNMTVNAQYLMTTFFNQVSLRSFRQIEWRYDLGWVITMRDDGYRESEWWTTPYMRAYHLSDGQEVMDFSPVQTVNNGQVTSQINGRSRAECASTAMQDGDFVLTGFEEIPFTVVEEDVERGITPYYVYGWSLHCRYVAVRMPTTDTCIGCPRQNWNTVVYDLQNSGRVVTFEDARRLPHRFSWSTLDEHLAVIETRHGAYLWNMETDARILLTDGVTLNGQSFLPSLALYGTFSYASQVVWDGARARIYAVTASAPNGTTAFDARTGEEIAFYTSGGSIEADFALQANNRAMIVYSYNYNSSTRRDDGRLTSFTVWDLNTGIAYEVNSGLRIATFLDTRVLVSPDLAYLVMFRRAAEGDRIIAHVWNLQTLSPTVEQRTPLYSTWFASEDYVGYYPTFIDSYTVEFSTLFDCGRGTCYRNYHFDVLSGEFTFIDQG